MDKIIAGSFRLSDGGVFALVPNPDPNDPQPDIWICSHLDVVARARTGAGQDWAYVLRFPDSDGIQKQWILPAAKLAGDGTEYRSILFSMGLEIAPGRKEKDLLTKYILACNPSARARIVTQIGWQEDGVFVLPDCSFGTSCEQIVFQGGR